MVAAGGPSLVSVSWLLIAAASLVVEHRLLGSSASVVVARGVSCPVAWGKSSSQLRHPTHRPLALAVGLTLDRQGSPAVSCMFCDTSK